MALSQWRSEFHQTDFVIDWVLSSPIDFFKKKNIFSWPLHGHPKSWLRDSKRDLEVSDGQRFKNEATFSQHEGSCYSSARIIVVLKSSQVIWLRLRRPCGPLGPMVKLYNSYLFMNYEPWHVTRSLAYLTTLKLDVLHWWKTWSPAVIRNAVPHTAAWKRDGRITTPFVQRIMIVVPLGGRFLCQRNCSGRGYRCLFLQHRSRAEPRIEHIEWSGDLPKLICLSDSLEVISYTYKVPANQCRRTLGKRIWRLS